MVNAGAFRHEDATVYEPLTATLCSATCTSFTLTDWTYVPGEAVDADVVVNVARPVLPGAICKLVCDSEPVHPNGAVLAREKTAGEHVKESLFMISRSYLSVVPGEPLWSCGVSVTDGLAEPHPCPSCTRARVESSS